MTRIFQRWWHACLAGLVIGGPTGIALEFARRAANEAAVEKVTREFESQGMSPPLMIDLLQPWVVPILTCVLFVLLSVSIYLLLAFRRRGSQHGNIRRDFECS